jgi:hypothetical protein
VTFLVIETKREDGIILITTSATLLLKFVFTNITPIFRSSGIDFEFEAQLLWEDKKRP